MEGIPPAAIGTPSQTHKKIIFVWEPGFGFGNVQTIYLDKLAQSRVISVNIMVFHVKI